VIVIIVIITLPQPSLLLLIQHYPSSIIITPSYLSTRRNNATPQPATQYEASTNGKPKQLTHLIGQGVQNAGARSRYWSCENILPQEERGMYFLSLTKYKVALADKSRRILRSRSRPLTPRRWVLLA